MAQCVEDSIVISSDDEVVEETRVIKVRTSSSSQLGSTELKEDAVGSAQASSMETDQLVARILRPIVGCCIIDLLVSKKFATGDYTESRRLEIIRGGRPPPTTKHLPSVPSLSWLTGCPTTDNLTCWPCLLFSSGDVWSWSGSDLGEIKTSAAEHELTPAHKETSLLLAQLEHLLQQAATSSPTAATHKSKKLPKQPKPCFVNRLLSTPFLSAEWTYDERQQIILKGPTRDEDTEHRQLSVPRRKHWLTTSEEISDTLFCWPCLLFANEAIRWPNCVDQTLSIEHHGRSNEHMSATLRLKVWEQRMKSFIPKGDPSIKLRYEKVKENRTFLEPLVNALCFYKKNLINSDNCSGNVADILKMISTRDSRFNKYLISQPTKSPENIILSLLSEYTEDILKSIEVLLRAKICKEINKAAYLCIILNSVENESFISVTVRYCMKNGDIFERFVKFIEPEDNHSLESVLKQMKTVVSELGCSEKLIGHSYDGAALKPEDVLIFEKGLVEMYPLSSFFHYSEQELLTTIQQSLAQHEYCRDFFHTINELKKFFHERPDCAKALIAKFAKDNPESQFNISLDTSYGLVTTIRNNYSTIVDFFESVKTSLSEWPTAVVDKASNFTCFLSTYQSRFLLVLTARISRDVHWLSCALKEKFDSQKLKSVVTNATELLDETKNTGFEDVMRSASSPNLTSSPDSEQTTDQPTTDKYMLVFQKLLHLTREFIVNRFCRLDVWDCCDLKQSCARGLWDVCNTHIVKYHTAFHPTQAQPQLHFVLNSPFFADKTAVEMIKCIHDMDMATTLPDVLRLLQLVATVPLAPSNSVQSPTITKTATYTSNNKVLNSRDALMWIERDTLTKIQRDPQFLKNIITHFSTVLNRKEFSYSAAL